MVVDGEGAPIPPAQAQLNPLRASQLEARAFYLDDGAAAGLWRYLVAWLAPCGSAAAVKEAVEKILDRAERRARAIASLPIASLPDPHVAMALLNSCAGFVCVVSLMRATGPTADYGRVDTFMRRADSVCAASLSCPRLALFPEVLTEVRDSLQAGAASVPRKQREWAVKISAARQESLLRNPLTGVRGQARVRSCAAKHASTWLYGAHNAPDDLWMSRAELTVAVRLRLGMPLAPRDRVCRLCGLATADRFGDHSLSCLNTGLRTRAHTALRDGVAALAREALLGPVLEDRPFTKHPNRNKRVDVLYEREGKRRLIDVAITFPLQPSSISKAAETEGGAATKYEAVKRAAYGPAIAAEAPEQQDLMLIPMVVDTFGAWGESALPELRALVSAVHRRHDWETYASVSHLASAIVR
ncbi:hypothetical protein DIPPA_22056 [Diplonema papillatum]|nr:hypothetical protein DIPPA_22056 [Diplonema papillatum]